MFFKLSICLWATLPLCHRNLSMLKYATLSSVFVVFMRAEVATLLARSLMMVSKPRQASIHSQVDRRKLATDSVSSVITVYPKVESSDRRPSWY